MCCLFHIMLRIHTKRKGSDTAPGAREGGDHLVHEARQGVGGHARDGVLAADDRDAPLAQRRQQRLAHQAARRAEGPALQACVRQSVAQEGHLLVSKSQFIFTEVQAAPAAFVRIADELHSGGRTCNCQGPHLIFKDNTSTTICN